MMRMLHENTITTQIHRLQIGRLSLRKRSCNVWATFTSFVLLNTALGLYLYLYLYLYNYARW